MIFVDPNGESVWEKISNFFSSGEWRDDTLEENFAQKDWENATPQIAEEAGIDTKITDVRYDKIDKEPRFTTVYDGKKSYITTTKNGFEVLGESNIANNVNSMTHEKKHVEQNAQGQIVRNSEQRITNEFEAIDQQRQHPSWSKTTDSYKQKIKNYENHWKRMREVGRRLEKMK